MTSRLPSPTFSHGSLARDAGEQFALRADNEELSPRHSGDRVQQTREAAGQLVASAFLIPYLASIRETSFAEGPFAPNIVERRFGPVMDQHVADQIMQSTNFNLVDTIVDRYPQIRGEGIDAASLPRAAEHSQAKGRQWTA